MRECYWHFMTATATTANECTMMMMLQPHTHHTAFLCWCSSIFQCAFFFPTNGKRDKVPCGILLPMNEAFINGNNSSTLTAPVFLAHDVSITCPLFLQSPSPLASMMKMMVVPHTMHHRGFGVSYHHRGYILSRNPKFICTQWWAKFPAYLRTILPDLLLLAWTRTLYIALCGFSHSFSSEHSYRLL